MGRHDRLAELTAVDRDGLVVADLGCGTGRTVRALLDTARPPALVHAVDHAMALDDDLLHDARVRSRIADLDARLPFGDGTLDRVVSMNVVESLADPAAFLAEVARVLAPGGHAVVGHTDFDTALFTSEDDALTRVLVDRFVADLPAGEGSRADGFMGRKLLGLALASPLDVADVRTWADAHRRFDEGSLAWKIAMGMLAATRDEPLLAGRAAEWVDDLRTLAEEGRFLFTVTDVVVVLRRS